MIALSFFIYWLPDTHRTRVHKRVRRMIDSYDCLTVAVRPLRVAELAEILVIDFRTPTYSGTSKLNAE